MCEVYLADGTPHPSNSRATILDDPETWFGFEQEYFSIKMVARSVFQTKASPLRKALITQVWGILMLERLRARSLKSIWIFVLMRELIMKVSMPKLQKVNGSSRSLEKVQKKQQMKYG